MLKEEVQNQNDARQHVVESLIATCFAAARSSISLQGDVRCYIARRDYARAKWELDTDPYDNIMEEFLTKRGVHIEGLTTPEATA